VHRPATEQIAEDLRGSLTRLDAAGKRTTEALNHAERVQVRSRGTGFRGIAEGMAQAVLLLRSIRVQVAALGGLVEKAAGPIQQTGDAANPDQVKAKLAAAANEVRAARTGMDTVLTELAQTRSHIATVLRGGKPGPLIAVVDGAKQAVAQAAGHLDSAQQKIDEAANEADQIGATGGGALPPGYGNHASADNDEPIPEWALAETQKLPERGDDKGPTVGTIFDDRGERLLDESIKSGRSLAPTDDLKLPRGVPDFPVTFTDHVESIVAAMMRPSDGPRRVTLVLNNVPCWKEMYSCEKILRHIIPEDSTLTVYGSKAGGPVRRFVYRGTGRGIAG